MTTTQAPTSALALWLGGLRASASLAVGYLPMAFSFGVVAVQAGLAAWQALLISLVVFSGAAQFVLVGLLAAGTGFWGALSAVWMLNLRHLFYGPALAAQMARPAGRYMPFIAFGLTDEMFATAMAASTRQRLSPPWCLGVACGAYGAWVLGTVPGAWLGGELVGDAGWLGQALSFVLPALFIALLGQAFQRALWPVVAVAGGVAALALVWVPSHLAMMLGMIAGAAVRPLLVGREASA